MSGYLLTKDLTAMFGVELRSVYRWVEDGKLNPIRAGRTMLFDPAEVARFKTERRNNPRIHS